MCGLADHGLAQLGNIKKHQKTSNLHREYSEAVMTDSYRVTDTLSVNGKEYRYYPFTRIAEKYPVDKLPFSLKILLENLLRHAGAPAVSESDIEALAGWDPEKESVQEIAFVPARVVLQDFTGVPAIVDLAAMRDAVTKLGGKPEQINPLSPVELVIDHSVMVDYFGVDDAYEKNTAAEVERNRERYQFLRWGQQAFDNFKVVPPGTCIVHQVNLEYLARGVFVRDGDDLPEVYPDSLVGTDSHTTMINGLGVLGWGVGGIEAEAGMLGQPSYFPAPEVIGVKFTGSFPQGTTATDLALKVTQVLREKNVVGKFVEYFGPGLKDMPLADRATISNMAPEYGATSAYFPIDEETLNYLWLTGRSQEQIDLVEEYCKKNDLWYSADQEDPEYTEIVEINLSELEPNLSSPKRTKDLIPLSQMQKEFNKAITAPSGNQGFGLDKSEFDKEASVKLSDGEEVVLKTGSLAIAAITSCTNTSNPYVMLGAGLLAKNAVEKGLKVPDFVKTSLAPGSTVVTRYLNDSGLTQYLDALGFNTVGYGCTTCIGNSGPLREDIEKAVMDADLTVASVLSGNRNFEGRIHPLSKANYLASPPLVVAYALAGSVDFDLRNDSLGKDKDGNDVYLKDIWPSMSDIKAEVTAVVNPKIFRSEIGRASC